jgi:hypothetical protein
MEMNSAWKQEDRNGQEIKLLHPIQKGLRRRRTSRIAGALPRNEQKRCPFRLRLLW